MDEQNSFDLVGALVGSVFGLLGLALAVAALVGMWKVFTKAGKPGLYAFIPILNIWTLVEITGLPTVWFWYAVLSVVLSGFTFGLTGLVGIFVTYILCRELRRVFGQTDDPISVIVFIVFSSITLPLLGLGNAQYLGPRQSADVPQLPWIK